MSTSKFILILSTMLVVASVFIFFILGRNESNKAITSTNQPGLPTANNNQTPNTATNITPEPSNTTVKTTIPSQPPVNNQEDVLQNNVSELLEQWQTSKDSLVIKQALELTSDSNNEALLYAWIPFMSNNSQELVLLIEAAKEDKESLIGTSALLFEWFVELSGSYEELSPQSRQQVLEGYEKIKMYTNERL